MAIIGLTDRGAQYPKIGTLHKGAKKQEGARAPGKDLEWFRFDSNDLEARTAFEHAYGKEPNNINVFLPYATTPQNFEAWREEWVKGGLVHRCDGQMCVIWREGHVYHRRETHGDHPCPGNCKPMGRLTVLVKELYRFATVTVLTTSINDIMAIQESLEAVEALRADLRGIPFILSRAPKEISMPETVTDRNAPNYGQPTGKRVRRVKWLLSLEIRPDWVKQQLTAMERAALPGSDIKLLADGSAVSQTTGERVDGPDVEEGEWEEERELTDEERHAAAFERLRVLRQRVRILGGPKANTELGTENQVRALPLEALEAEIEEAARRLANLEQQVQQEVTA